MGAKRRRFVSLGLVATAAVVASVTQFPAVAEAGEILSAGSATAKAGSYIVELKASVQTRSSVQARAETLAARVNGRVGHTYEHAFHGFELSTSEEQARRLAADPAVAAVHQSQVGQTTAFQRPVPSWGLDRVDQRSNQYDNTFVYPSRAERVTAYVVDSGIRFDHRSFDGRAVSGVDTVDNDGVADDCNGHGTFVAGVLGGSWYGLTVDTNYGVAKSVRLVAVRVTLDCSVYIDEADALAGLEWVLADHDPGEVAVANMSLTFRAGSSLVDRAVERLIDEGVVVVAGSDNMGVDSCADLSPGRVPRVITVSATTPNDERPAWSNYGPCVDIFAPGLDITSASHINPERGRIDSGVSFAAPHVAGAAALVLDAHPEYTPADVANHLRSNASGVVRFAGAGTTNKLLYVTQEPQADRFRLRVDPATVTTVPGGSVTVTVHATLTWGQTRPVTLSASGMPTGVSVVFAPQTIPSGSSAQMTITAATTVPTGTGFPILVTGTGPHTSTAVVNVTVGTGSGGCVGTNPNRVPITGHGSFISEIVITGCDRTASARSHISITVTTNCRAVLEVTLYAPDGTQYRLKNIDSSPAICKDNWAFRGRKNLSREAANGTWRMEVYNTCNNCGTGHIKPWTLTLHDP